MMKNENKFQIAGLEITPGERWQGTLMIGGGEFVLPAAVLHGEKEGKTVLITAAVHPGEYVGVETAVELANELKMEKITGTIVIVKVVCPEEFEQRAGSLCLDDRKNLNRQFPGDEKGTRTQRLASAIKKELHSVADYYIDLHSGDEYEDLTPFVYYAGKGEKEVIEVSRKMAQHVDVPYMVRSNVESGGSYNYAASCGIPSILIERGGMGRWTREEVESNKRDLKNILRYLGIYRTSRGYWNHYPMEVTDVVYQSANQAGLWYPDKKPGDMFSEGEKLGKVTDYEGKTLETSYGGYDGVILFQTGSLQVTKEGPMIAYGRIAYEKDDRKEKIAGYWTKRSSDFKEQRREELHSPLAKRWIEEIAKYLPEKEHLRILDVGCGAGFFSILLAKRGHQVTGIDLTPDMILHARELAKEEQIDCRFEIMDAENLNFPDATFDVVISRNLTWNLEKPEQAYQEWMRVLKPGGVLLNFDANWYGYLYDEEKKEAYEADRKKVEEQQLDDHYLCTDIDRMENIARQVPLSAMERPAWDTKVLESLGVCSIQTDSEIWKRVWSEEERLNYASTPMFLVRAEKSAEQPFQLGDVTVRRGEKYQGVSEDGLWYPAAKPGDMVTEGGPVVAYGRIVREPEYDDRKEQIVHYWEKRSENFLEQRRSELANPIAKRWMKEIEKQIPAGRRLKILDVGCGAGFFSILLAKEGHEVFGIDLTPEMIENAIQLAEEENADCCFQVMDAENPMFADETFDVVISRNLTWTLPNAEHAYGEWMRVLKTGGVLLNFDANYGKEDVADTKGLPEAHAHFKVGNEMLEECERIKSQLPISRKNRPAYDVAVLCENTAGEIRIDTSLGKRIYLEKDEFYNPAPMFSICAVKQ